jgi:hypothetical protein
MPIRNYVFNERFTPTNFNTYSINNGLKWLDTQSTAFGASSLTSSVFTTEFDYYRIVINSFRPSVTNEALLFRMRTSGGQYSGATYNWAYNGVVWATAGAIGNNAVNSNNVQITNCVTNRMCSATIELNNVRTSCRPTFSWQAIDQQNNCSRLGGAFIANTADYTGFDVFTSSGNVMFCNMSVYGYRKP